MEWISVEDRLPEWGQTVIVYYKGNYDPGLQVTSCTHYAPNVWTEADVMKGGRPIGWMPLPKPPKRPSRKRL